MTSQHPILAQVQPNNDLSAAGAAALDEYLTTCRTNAIVPDVGGAWASAFRAGADYAALAVATQAGPATWDLIEQLVQLECSRERLHMEYMGKAMPADVYLRFQKLRDERIPALQAQLRGVLAAASTVCDSVHTADSRKLASTTAPKAQTADALDAETIKKAARYEWLRDISVPPHNFYLSVPEEFGGVKYAPAEVDAEIDAAIAAMATAQEKR
ncbi:hypothetical protein [Comamonas sp. JUb58]|uniref:hypothetical protein n=1 Tax=Comamonas sp. JUb58 TaxID=2485114 RepID=UPI00105B87D4|nr:hypothetical protein [Comamonas sp. JUb58]TDS74376.1 hypothetical protein EDF71_11756 [Comamonas sp. JUb58]